MQRCCPPAEIPELDLASEALLFKALADAHRLIILAALDRSQGEVCVCDFTDALPLNQPTVSHHLRVLREAGLVTCERRGTWVYYRLASGARERLSGALTSVFRQKVPA
jgi:ArsR family transcriptional regulator, arsenate/arsenite/antimonite-responsive transcriptional repressor